ncbi:MAG: hemerythrin domain-containing protein [Rhodocyclales bacterium]|nr:hemerythrin domain-containing protein [Rhodocyclales bacterium]
MFLLDLIFGKHAKESAAPRPTPAPAAPAPVVAPGTSIQYHPEIIDLFKHDHRELLRVFAGIKAAIAAQDLPRCAELLEDFRHTLHGHLLSENVRLYIYLEHALASDPTSHDLMHSFRHEMDDIGKAVVAFLERYRYLAEHPELLPQFAHELDGIGKVLVERIKREEETLYPLYMPA